MPTPTVNDVQAVETVETRMLIGYQQADTRFVAGRVFPGAPVEKDSGTYYIFTKKYFFLNDLQPRAPGGPFHDLNIGVETDTFATFQWSGGFPLADEVAANSQVPFPLLQAGIKRLAQASLIRKEVSFATDFMANAVWGTSDNNAATDWDDFAAGDPVANFLTARRTISNNTGLMPNAAVMGLIVEEALLNHPDVLDRLKYTTAATQAAIRAALGAILGVGELMVSEASYSNTNEAAAFSASAIIDDDCLICHINPGAGLYEATAGKTFHWGPGGGLGMVRQWRDDAHDTDRLKHKEQWDQKITASDLGYIFLDIV